MVAEGHDPVLVEHAAKVAGMVRSVMFRSMAKASITGPSTSLRKATIFWSARRVAVGMGLDLSTSLENLSTSIKIPDRDQQLEVIMLARVVTLRN